MSKSNPGDNHHPTQPVVLARKSIRACRGETRPIIEEVPAMGVTKTRRSVLFVVGDLSGDIYTSRLAERLASRRPHLLLHALGGKHLGKIAQDSGGVWVGDTTNCSAIGISSVVRIYIHARWLQHRLREFVRKQSVDAVVLCDWGGFNCRQLDFFKRTGIPILYYFPPRSWQRCGQTGIQFTRYVNRVATPFAWSASRLTAAGCRADWVGHPLLESIEPRQDREALRKEFHVIGEEKLVALLPGSRKSEIRVLGPRLAAVAANLAHDRAIKFVVPVPQPMEAEVRSVFPSHIQIVVDRADDVLRACDVAIVKTGSATLEAAVADAPQIAIYDFGWVGRMEWVFLWMWKRIPYVAMPNIILERMVVPELVGLKCRVEAIAAAARTLLDCQKSRKIMRAGYQEVRAHLGQNQFPGATEKTVAILEEMLGEVAEPATWPNSLSTTWLNRFKRIPEPRAEVLHS